MANVVHVETVLLENSDDRLAAVEEAKRTGQPFQSVAANKTEVVPVDVAAQIMEEYSQQDTYVDSRFGATHAAHLESYHEKIQDPEFVLQTNEEKAAAHEAYSAELVRKQMEDEKRVQEMKAEGYDPSVAVQQANLERAREHDVKSLEYDELRRERAKDRPTVMQVVDESVEALNAIDLARAPLEERANALRGVGSVTVPDALENPARDALITKDAIIETAIDYRSEVASHEELVKRDRPGIVLMDQAGSPEELNDSTKVAQLYAANVSEKAGEAAVELDEAALEASDSETSPGEVLREAEEAVDGRPAADEMRENPSE